jgi:hypothetical protein
MGPRNFGYNFNLFRVLFNVRQRGLLGLSFRLRPGRVPTITDRSRWQKQEVGDNMERKIGHIVILISTLILMLIFICFPPLAVYARISQTTENVNFVRYTQILLSLKGFYTGPLDGLATRCVTPSLWRFWRRTIFTRRTALRQMEINRDSAVLKPLARTSSR